MGYEGSQYDPDYYPTADNKYKTDAELLHNAAMWLVDNRDPEEQFLGSLRPEETDENVATALEQRVRDNYETQAMTRPRGNYPRPSYTSKKEIVPLKPPIPSDSRIRYKIAESQN